MYQDNLIKQNTFIIAPQKIIVLESKNEVLYKREEVQENWTPYKDISPMF
mgnify:FL=1